MIEVRHRCGRGSVRGTVEMAVRPHAGVENRYRRFGPACTLGVGPFRYVHLLGPDANRFVFGTSELFGWREAFDALVVVDGDQVISLIAAGHETTSAAMSWAAHAVLACDRGNDGPARAVTGPHHPAAGVGGSTAGESDRDAHSPWTARPRAGGRVTGSHRDPPAEDAGKTRLTTKCCSG